MTPKERQILKEMVRKQILKEIDNKPIKMKNLISENYKNWEIGKVMTLKDNPPFKTPKQIEEEKLTEKVSDIQKRKIYKKAFGKEYDAKRQQAALPLDIAYQVALYRLKKIKEGKLTDMKVEGKKIQVDTMRNNIKFQLDVEKEARNIIDALKVDKKKLTPKNISDYINAEYKFFKTPSLNHQVFKYIKKNLKKLSEGKLNEKFDLKKLEDAIKMFQQKIKKQGRVTNARDEQHLKQLIKVYKDMGGRKIKEGKLKEVKGVDKVLSMAKNHSFGKLGGKTVDAMSAGLFKQVYDKADDKSKEKINKMNEKQLYVFMTKLWSKFGKQVRI